MIRFCFLGERSRSNILLYVFSFALDKLTLEVSGLVGLKGSIMESSTHEKNKILYLRKENAPLFLLTLGKTHFSEC